MLDVVNPGILVVDDEPVITRMIGKFLKMKGFIIQEASDGEEALVKCGEFRPEVVILDVKMPKMGGLDCLRRIKQDHPDVEVIMATAFGDADMAIEAMKDGAFGYQVKPLDLEGLYTEVTQALKHRKLVLENKKYQESLETRVEERTQEVNTLNEKLRVSFVNSVRILTNLLEVYDPFLGGHSKRVAFWSVQVGMDQKLSKGELFHLELGALLHDIGTVAVPDKLYRTQFAELKEEETALIKQHPVFAQKVLSHSEELQTPATYIRHHLERLDGTGFPDGLKEKKIPLGARIIGLVNAFDELRYRRRFSQEKFSTEKEEEEFAIFELYKKVGKHYERAHLEALERGLERVRSSGKASVQISIANLEAGMVLAGDLFASHGALLFAKGTAVNEIQAIKLKNLCKMGLLKEVVLVYESGK